MYRSRYDNSALVTKCCFIANDDIFHRWQFQSQQAVRLGRRHNMPPPHLDFWPFDLDVGVGVACDLGCPCAKFRLPRPFGFRVRADVRDIRQTDGRTDGRTTDADDRLMPNKWQGFTPRTGMLEVGFLGGGFTGDRQMNRHDRRTSLALLWPSVKNMKLKKH